MKKLYPITLTILFLWFVVSQLIGIFHFDFWICWSGLSCLFILIAKVIYDAIRVIRRDRKQAKQWSDNYEKNNTEINHFFNLKRNDIYNFSDGIDSHLVKFWGKHSTGLFIFLNPTFNQADEFTRANQKKLTEIEVKKYITKIK